MKIRIDGTPEEIEQAAHIFGPSCGPIKITKKRDGGNFGYLEVEERPKIICLDCETTGLDPNEDEILSLSIVDWDGNVLHDRKYKPARKTEWPDAERVNGISPESVAECRGIWQDDGRIGQIICDADEIIGYNVGFDMSFLVDRQGPRVPCGRAGVPCDPEVRRCRVAPPPRSRGHPDALPEFQVLTRYRRADADFESRINANRITPQNPRHAPRWGGL